eukprot:TRINITY_DN21600_c0_g1_i1.p1 TRINITY_DN21600_c0_g1~~TRINITY_DN21600_c0_g1_i1.p1  ORF type:complete len:861 (-),score=234.49 TRINITY_DN21600_c0_g1_i1:205-2787(-)
MGFSKKKLKHKLKQDKRVTPKAKQRAKKAKQIDKSNKLKASKRAAAAATGNKDAKVKDISSVDELLGALGEDIDDEAKSNCGASQDGSDSSSAGGFCEVDGDDDSAGGDLPVDLAGLDDDDGDGGASHEQELQEIKKRDPAFYKFLLENDRNLLDFTDPEGGDKDDDAEKPGEDDEQEERGEDEAEAKVDAAHEVARVVTVERVRTLQDNARNSFTAFKAVLTAYHAAIRSIEKLGAAADEEEDGDDRDDSKSRRRRKRASKSLMHIGDEATFSAIIEWTVANFTDLLEHHGGELRDGGKKGGGSKRDKRWKKKGKKGGEADAEGDANLFLDPSKYTRWAKVKIMASIFWNETYFLLTRLTATEMQEFVLRHISTQRAIVWLWPFRIVRRKFFNKSCGLWSSSSAHQVRLLAFLFLRNSAAMSTMAPKEQKPMKKDQTELEAMIRGVLRAFAEAANTNFSWRSVSTFRFMENCFIELLRIDDHTSYRIGYVCIRQLALILRNASIANSQGGSVKKGANKDKQRKKKALHQQQVQNLVGWPFVRAMHLWTKALPAISCLKPLAYPLATIITGALKAKLTSIQFFPFVFQCFRCLNKLSANLEVFVPVSSHILKAMSVLLPNMEKAYKSRAAGTEGSAPAKAPEIDVLLRFTEGQTNEVMTLEAVGGCLCFLIVDHLGILSRSPSFPEVSYPVLFHLKKNTKHCRSENIRRQLKQIVANTEAAAQDIAQRREGLTEVSQWKRFFVFEADSAIAKARKEALARKEREERQRVEAETAPEAKSKFGKKSEEVGVEKDEGDDERDAKKQKRKNKKQEKRKMAAEEQEKKKKARHTLELQAKGIIPGKAKEDVVEEMGFSSGTDED